jgi:hypothetical protein
MGWNEPDLYNQPEKFGLEIIGDIDWSMESYQFNMTVVLVDPSTGLFYTIDDAGCSCPSPFENHTSRTDLGEPMTAWEVIQELEEERDRIMAIDDRWNTYGHVPGDVADLIQDIRNYNHVPPVFPDNIEISNN